jgi:hypothetical protein
MGGLKAHLRFEFGYWNCFSWLGVWHVELLIEGKHSYDPGDYQNNAAREEKPAR